MDASLTEVIAAITAVGGMIGISVKFWVDRVTTRQTAMEKKQDEKRTRQDAQRIAHELKVEQERIRWEQVMRDQMTEMRREIRIQEREIGWLQMISDSYVRHIAALEGLMRAKGIDIPILRVPERPVFDDIDDSDEPHHDRRGRRRQIEAC